MQDDHLENHISHSAHLENLRSLSPAPSSPISAHHTSIKTHQIPFPIPEPKMNRNPTARLSWERKGLRGEPASLAWRSA